MVSGVKSMIKSENWTTIYPSKSIDIFKGGKQGNVVDLLGSLAINGSSKTTDVAKFIYGNKFHKLLKNNSDDDSKNNSDNDPDDIFPWDASDIALNEIRKIYLEKLRSNFKRLLTGRRKLSHSGKKITDSEGNFIVSPNPIDFGYVINTGKIENDKGNFIPHYFLTLKGFFLILGYDFNPNELKSMIDNASKISMFFCFMKKVMDDYNIKFVTEIFIKPIQRVLLRSDIFQGGDMDFYFGNFADAISESLYNKMELVNEKRKENIRNKPDSYFSKKITKKYMQLHPTRHFSDLIRIKRRENLQDTSDMVYQFRVAGIEQLMKKVFYSDKPKDDWYDSLFDYFYPKKESQKLFLKFGYDSENILMNKVMRSLSQTYAYFDNGILPYKENKLPRSKAWEKHQKFKQKGSKSDLENEFDLSNL